MISATGHLALINLLIGDIQGGLGPFLSTWLAGAAWTPARIGLVTTIVGLGTLVLNTPAGALVDHLPRPRLLLGLGCAGILVGTLLLLPARGFLAVLAAQFLAATGGTIVPPAMTALTLGIVGKASFPRQQGRNQAWNHVGILSAAVLIQVGASGIGAGVAFWILAAMAVGSLVAIAATPGSAWNACRAHGWNEAETATPDKKHPVHHVLGNARLLLLAAALALFALGNGPMLSLIGQRMVARHQDATSWVAVYVFVAQLTMVPVALWAGSLCDRHGRRRLLLLAAAALTLRAGLSAWVTSPFWLIPAEVLDGVGSGVLGVAVPVLVADITWGSGRTQTALGTVNALQGIGGALSGVFGGLLVQMFGWNSALLLLGVPAVASLLLALRLEETRHIGLAYHPRRGGGAMPAAGGAS